MEYIFQLIWYSRACGSYHDFLDRGLLLTRKLLDQWFLLGKLKSSLRKFYGRHHVLVDCCGIYATKMNTDIFHFLVLYSFMTYHTVCTRLTRRVPLVEHELLNLPEHMSSSPVFSGVRVTRYLVLCVCFVDRCLVFFIWPLCCLSFDIRIPITSLISWM